MTKRAKL